MDVCITCDEQSRHNLVICHSSKLLYFISLLNQQSTWQLTGTIVCCGEKDLVDWLARHSQGASLQICCTRRVRSFLVTIDSGICTHGAFCSGNVKRGFSFCHGVMRQCPHKCSMLSTIPQPTGVIVLCHHCCKSSLEVTQCTPCYRTDAWLACE